MTPIEIVINETPDRRGVFEARADGRLLCRTSTPFLDAARVLMVEHAPPEAIVIMRHDGASVPALTARLGAAAALDVEETRFGPKFRRHRKAAPTAVNAPPVRPNEPAATMVAHPGRRAA